MIVHSWMLAMFWRHQLRSSFIRIYIGHCFRFCMSRRLSDHLLLTESLWKNGESSVYWPRKKFWSRDSLQILWTGTSKENIHFVDKFLWISTTDWITSVSMWFRELLGRIFGASELYDMALTWWDEDHHFVPPWYNLSGWKIRKEKAMYLDLLI